MWQENGRLTYVSVKHELAQFIGCPLDSKQPIVVITTNYWMNSGTLRLTFYSGFLASRKTYSSNARPLAAGISPHKYTAWYGISM